MTRLVSLPVAVLELAGKSREFKVPWFVAWLDGKPEFRVADPRKFHMALSQNMCWICGGPLGQYKAFIAGPMCAISRTVADPPSHLTCAQYAVVHCPFLNDPTFERRSEGRPKEIEAPPGIFIQRNPGVSLIWVTRNYKCFAEGQSVLMTMGEPTNMFWYRQGRQATQDEILTSLEEGCPIAYESAHEEGEEAVALLDRLKAELVEKIRAQYTGDRINA